MVFKDLYRHLDVDILSLFGELKISIVGFRAISISNYLKIVNFTDQQVVFKIKNNTLYVEGFDFKMAEMEKSSVTITGKISKLYLDK